MKRIKRFLRGVTLLAKSIFIEKPKGIDFSLRQKKHNIHAEGNNGYALTQKKAFDNIMKLIDINENDCFIDIGCGKGATLYYATKYPFKRIAGIEIEPSLYNIAEKNFKTLKLPDIELFNDNALSFDKYSQFNVYFLFNPFSTDIYKQVIDKLAITDNSEFNKVYLICYGDSPTDYIAQYNRWELLYDYIDNVRVTNVHVWKKK